MAGVDRPTGPQQGGEEGHAHPRGVDRTPGSPHQDGKAGESQDQPQHGGPGQPLAGGDPVDQGHPQGDARHDQGHHARGDVAMLGPHHAAVAAQEQRPSDDGRGSPLGGAHLIGPVAAPDRPGEQDRPRNQESDGGHEERRDGSDGDLDGQVGGAPHHVEDAEREQNRTPGGASRPAQAGKGPDGDTAPGHAVAVRGGPIVQLYEGPRAPFEGRWRPRRRSGRRWHSA